MILAKFGDTDTGTGSEGGSQYWNFSKLVKNPWNTYLRYWVFVVSELRGDREQGNSESTEQGDSN